MKQAVNLLALLAFMAGSALAGGGHVPSPAPAQITVKHAHFACAHAQSVQVDYVDAGPVLAVLTYRGERYGLAPAVSASGSRFVGLAGLDNASGLEWWEHQGAGTLSRYDPQTGETRPLLHSCKRSS